MEIEDWPDFAVRGVMLDISRDKVPTMRTLRRLVDLLASVKINQLQLYTEHTFAFSGHERVWRGASPMNGRQIETLDRWCTARGIELVPNQNSFGHMERWLKHEPYRRLAETEAPWKSPWGTVRNKPTTLNPLDPRSLRLVKSLYDQILPHFTSRLLNVGCDETFELGQGRSAAACRQRGVGRVYLDYLMKLHQAVQRRGRRMMFWSDIIHEHPELIRHLPRDVVPLVWGYEADHPFAGQCAAIKRCGLAFYVCPGTSSWCSFSGRTRNAIENLRNAAMAGRRFGASGYLVTDWGDYGHRQYLPASYAAYLYSAALSWCAASNTSIDVGNAVSRHALGSADSKLGGLWLEAGRVHELSGIAVKNRTVLFNIIEASPDAIRKIGGLTPRRLLTMERRISQLARSTRAVRAANPEQQLAKKELLATLDVLNHACRRGLWALAGDSAARRDEANRLNHDMTRIMQTHRALWLARNRPGGLASSLAYFELSKSAYEE